MARHSLFLLLFLIASASAAGQTCNLFVGGYIPSWKDPAAVDYSKITHAFYAFATTDASGSLIVDAPPVFNNFLTASAGKQRFLSVGGGGNNALTSMTANATARHTFVANCTNFCVSNNLQGIDVDWEGIITAQDSVLYGTMMRELAVSLHGHGLQLSATVAYGSYGGDFYNVGALKTADWVQLMVYDQTGTWAASPFGNHSTYQHVLDAVSYWTFRGYTDLSKMVIGLPFYGYQFNSTQGGLATGVTYAQIESQYPDLSCDTDDVGLIVFNGPETIYRKVQYVVNNGLKGVMIWEMSQDISPNNKRSLLAAVSLAACGQPRACDIFYVLEVPTDGPMVIYPNPAKSSITIELAQPGHELYKIDLFNSLGQKLITRESTFPEKSETISLTGISQGIFYVSVTKGDRVIIKRIVKSE